MAPAVIDKTGDGVIYFSKKNDDSLLPPQEGKP
jgi:hypothetical protein